MNVECAVVGRTREVEPLGVTELVAHEVEIALAGKSMSDESDDLV